jgi:hypothetical protein
MFYLKSIRYLLFFTLLNLANCHPFSIHLFEGTPDINDGVKLTYKLTSDIALNSSALSIQLYKREYSLIYNDLEQTEKFVPIVKKSISLNLKDFRGYDESLHKNAHIVLMHGIMMISSNNSYCFRPLNGILNEYLQKEPIEPCLDSTVNQGLELNTIEKQTSQFCLSSNDALMEVFPSPDRQSVSILIIEPQYQGTLKVKILKLDLSLVERIQTIASA